jgi:hypothetical protein
MAFSAQLSQVTGAEENALRGEHNTLGLADPAAHQPLNNIQSVGFG